ncbi:MAG TPA: endolytic transglycosylase MltG [Thermoanaerobaculia bacterium]|nr:endolytic transglycosylase MltG [Thermoanaerobaculia bacterium]
MAMIVFAIGGGVFFWRALVTPYKGFTAPQVQVEVKHGAGSADILRKLEAAGVLRDSLMPLVYLKTIRRGALLKAGIYQFDRPAAAVDVLDKLIRGDVIMRMVTIREGLDRFAIGQIMAAEHLGTAAEWKKVTAEIDAIQDLDPAAESLEGYLFPDTYKITPGMSPKNIARLMVDNFRRNFGHELAYISSGLSLHDTVTLASIVETEARLPAERQLVASVYLNRFHKNMLLQADPTVIYAMKLSGSWNGNIRKGDLHAASPYNTYVSHGFPPGPIANPGLASLRAAANPAPTEYLYFVARNDGSHAFARTLEEHNKNVMTFQKLPFRHSNTAPQSR